MDEVCLVEMRKDEASIINSKICCGETMTGSFQNSTDRGGLTGRAK
jgi:hypothetical protein